MKLRANNILVCLFCLFTVNGLLAQEQEVMVLTNPSFEDIARASKQPRGWSDCGMPNESPPDTHPNAVPSESFGVDLPSFHKSTYLGLVIRDNETWEGVSQRLKKPLERGKCYEFRLHLARSKRYISQSRLTNTTANYSEPAKIRIWGGYGNCTKQELLDESAMVTNFDWKEYAFKFEPTMSHKFITIEAFYRTPSLFPYNGNVLVDNASPIKVIPCDQEPALLPIVTITKPKTEKYRVSRNVLNVKATVDNIHQKKDITVKLNGRKRSFRYDPNHKRVTAAVFLLEGNNRVEIIAKNSAGQASDKVILIYEAPITASKDPLPPTPKEQEKEKEDEPFVATNTPELNDIKKIKTGQVIRINKLYFDVDSYMVKSSAYGILDEVYQFLRRNPGVSVEIGGHTNNRCTTNFCDELSENRAKAVSSYLIKKGIPEYRIQYKGYGKRKPIATNNTPTGRKRNQRVEIKILSVSG